MATNPRLGTLRSTAAPRLPTSPAVPDGLYLDQLNNVLRLYFNQLDGLLAALTAGIGPAPYGAFQDATTQTAPANVAQVIRFDTTDFTNGVSLDSQTASFTASIATTNMTVTVATAGSIYLGMTLTGTGVSAGTRVVSQTSGTAGGVGVYVVSISHTVASTVISGAVQSKMVAQYSGIYNLQWSGQFVNTTASVHDVSVWLRQDAAGAALDIPGSTGVFSVIAKHGGFDGSALVGWNYFIKLAAGEYVELWWSTPDVATFISAFPAGTSPTRPATASIIATMSFVSAFPA